MNIIVGHYGSGKTEFAVNFTLKRLEENIRKSVVTKLVDMDVVNPYFRSSDMIEFFTDKGIEVISPQFSNTNADVPSISSQFLSCFGSGKDVVVDAGGDDDGVLALAQFSRKIAENGYHMLLVINTFRPLSKTLGGIQEFAEKIESASKLRISGIVNNSNIMNMTEVSDILVSHEICMKASEALDVPLKYTCFDSDRISVYDLPESVVNPFPMKIYTGFGKFIDNFNV